MNPPALLRVHGEPCPQGSKVAFVRGGRAVMMEGHKKGRAALNEWRDRVHLAGQTWRVEQDLPLYDGPLRVVLSFHIARPGSIRTRPYPHVRPDVDKLARAVLDGLTGSLWVDDSRVVDLRAIKFYAATAAETGAVVTVEEIL